MKKLLSLLCAAALMASMAVSACAEDITLTVAAAASLEYSYVQQLIPLFEKQNPGIQVEGTYDSSGKLQSQIENGLDADVFMSAAVKQMNALVSEGYIDPESVVELLENKIVLIKPKGGDTKVTSFENAADCETIALGDPASVPAGQYAQEAFTTLGNWDAVSAKASFGTNVTEVCAWVENASADCGVVYATDAAQHEVDIIAAAPEGSLSKKVIYPVAVLSGSSHKEAAQKFVDFLASEEALAVFESYGFTPNQTKAE